MPAIAIHPGEHLAEELKELGMIAAELARARRGVLDLAEGSSRHFAKMEQCW